VQVSELTDKTSQMLGTIDVADILVLGTFFSIVPQLANFYILMTLKSLENVSQARPGSYVRSYVARDVLTDTAIFY
jgi:hypothetical protein